MARTRKKKEEIQYTINMALPHESNARLAAYKAKKPSSQKPMKMCIRCKQVLPLTAFYSNKGNREGKFTDIYCKECAQKMCKDKESVKKYFWDNNRLWKEIVWEKAQDKAEVALSANTGYLDKRITNEQRARKLERETALKCLT